MILVLFYKLIVDKPAIQTMWKIIKFTQITVDKTAHGAHMCGNIRTWMEMGFIPVSYPGFAVLNHVEVKEK